MAVFTLLSPFRARAIRFIVLVVLAEDLFLRLFPFSSALSFRGGSGFFISKTFLFGFGSGRLLLLLLLFLSSSSLLLRLLWLRTSLSCSFVALCVMRELAISSGALSSVAELKTDPLAFSFTFPFSFTFVMIAFTFSKGASLQSGTSLLIKSVRAALDSFMLKEHFVSLFPRVCFTKHLFTVRAGSRSFVEPNGLTDLRPYFDKVRKV